MLTVVPPTTSRSRIAIAIAIIALLIPRIFDSVGSSYISAAPTATTSSTAPDLIASTAHFVICALVAPLAPVVPTTFRSPALALVGLTAIIGSASSSATPPSTMTVISPPPSAAAPGFCYSFVLL